MAKNPGADFKKEIAIANMNSGLVRMAGCESDMQTGDPFDGTLEFFLPTSHDERFRAMVTLNDLGLAPEDLIADSIHENLAQEIRQAECLKEPGALERIVHEPGTVGYAIGVHEVETCLNDTQVESVKLMKSGIQKLVAAGIRHPALDVIAEYANLHGPSNFRNRA